MVNDVTFGAFFTSSRAIGSTKVDAEFSAQWLQSESHSLTNGTLENINSLTTDACNIMRSL